MKKVLIYGVYDFDNLGDDYMLAMIDQYLKKRNICPIYIKNCSIENYFNTKVKRDFEWLFNTKYKNKVAKLYNILKWYINKENISNIDALVFMGGGYTSETFGTRNLLILLLLCKKFKTKNIYFTGQTVGPVHKKINQYLIRRIYRSGIKVFVREKSSKEYLKTLNIKSELVGDDAFLTPNIIKAPKKEEYMIYNYKEFEDYHEYKENYFKILLKIAKNKKLKVKVIPFRSNKNSKEFKSNYELFLYLKRNQIPVEFVVERDIKKFQNIISHSEMIIGTAYHSIVLGLIYNNKVFSYYNGKYYQQKIKGILNWYGISKSNSEKMEKISTSYNKLLQSIQETDLSRNANTTQEIRRKVIQAWDSIINDITNEKGE